ncbi:hypothetical protein T552_03085 [Pneumocystis carinii B80]|uniref:Ribosomal protein S21 n=1 Tax=Pneumocystis carinii (strain B80) TaxID=1408658 RepID=A0A0W4ZCY6_PNEC8|nr:hypothetical protein T552_03085 [Pneumocystis carinii B80]KTW26193.1 hypothetical protein T552_03085 [Pneumocystis carinii B80]
MKIINQFSRNLLNYRISNFLQGKFILWKTKILIEKYQGKEIKHLSTVLFKCDEKTEDKGTLFPEKEVNESIHNDYKSKTIEPISSLKKTSEQSPTFFMPLDSLKNNNNNDDDLQNKHQKLPICNRAASREVKNQDIASSWRSLDILLKQNNVRRDERMGRFYEKPTKKRNRLRSERHRKRFKASIRRLVSIVKEMKHKGI